MTIGEIILMFFISNHHRSNTDIHRVKEAPTRKAEIILRDNSNTNTTKNEQLHLTILYRQLSRSVEHRVEILCI